MITNDPLEMKQLTQNWSDYLSSLRLKLLLYLNAETVRFLLALKFLSCEENFQEFIAYSLMTTFYDVDMPEYKLLVKINNQQYELSHFPSPSNWQISSQSLDVFFKLNQTQTKFLVELLDNFDIFATLARIRTAIRITKYKEKYLKEPVLISDIVNEKDEFFLILPDGVKAKLIEANN